MFDEFTREERLAFCRAMANIIASDHKITEDERNELDGLILGTGLSPSDPEVVKEIGAELANPGSLTGIVKPIQKKDMQAALFRMLCEAACADGEIAAEERAKVVEAAGAFGFDRGAASELVDWTLQSIQHEKREQAILARLA